MSGITMKLTNLVCEHSWYHKKSSIKGQRFVPIFASILILAMAPSILPSAAGGNGDFLIDDFSVGDIFVVDVTANGTCEDDTVIAANVPGGERTVFACLIVGGPSSAGIDAFVEEAFWDLEGDPGEGSVAFLYDILGGFDARMGGAFDAFGVRSIDREFDTVVRVRVMDGDGRMGELEKDWGVADGNSLIFPHSDFTDDPLLDMGDLDHFEVGLFSDNGNSLIVLDSFVLTSVPVGGTVLSPDSVSLLLLEAENNAVWWLPAVILAGSAIALFSIKKRA